MKCNFTLCVFLAQHSFLQATQKGERVLPQDIRPQAFFCVIYLFSKAERVKEYFDQEVLGLSLASEQTVT